MTGRLLKVLRRTPILGPRLIRAELERRYHSVFGRMPNIDAPASFNEWILHRTLHDRDPRLRTICDKLAVRDFIRERAGPEFVVPLLGVWQDPTTIAWNTLPRRFVFKPNHSSGLVAMVRTETDLDPAALAARAAEWLAHDFFDVNFEWGYQDMPRCVLAEPLLEGPGGGQPPEARIFTIHGKAILIRTMTGEKWTPGRGENWFEASGRAIPLRADDYATGDFALLATDARILVSLAERVAAGFSHMRVDIYLTGDGPKIGELTPYHNCGRMRWKPPEWDERLGRLWAAGAPAHVSRA